VLEAEVVVPGLAGEEQASSGGGAKAFALLLRRVAELTDEHCVFWQPQKLVVVFLYYDDAAVEKASPDSHEVQLWPRQALCNKAGRESALKIRR
jgi:hypothetical protein